MIYTVVATDHENGIVEYNHATGIEWDFAEEHVRFFVKSTAMVILRKEHIIKIEPYGKI